MSNSRIHWYLQEGEAFFLPLEFCISNVFFFSNDVIRGRFHAKFPFFSSAAFVGHLGRAVLTTLMRSCLKAKALE
jgi:hypothetical protein